MSDQFTSDSSGGHGHTRPDTDSACRSVQIHQAQEYCRHIRTGETNHDANRQEQANIPKFLEGELKLFRETSEVSNITEHRIIMRDNHPTKQRYFPRNLAIIDAKVDQLNEKGCIERSYSPYSAPITLTKNTSCE